jgi:ribosome-associated heat shock protein Hsp15
LASRRGTASEAAVLYEESQQSIKTRLLLAEQLKLNDAMAPRSHGRPTKRERRKLVQFTRQED